MALNHTFYKTLVYKYQHLYLETREEAWVIAHIYNDGGATYKDHGTINYVSKGKWGNIRNARADTMAGWKAPFGLVSSMQSPSVIEE